MKSITNSSAEVSFRCHQLRSAAVFAPVPTRSVPLLAATRQRRRSRSQDGPRSGYAEPLHPVHARSADQHHGIIPRRAEGGIESEPWLAAHYCNVGGRLPTRGQRTGSFLFRGLRNNVSSVKSTAKIDLTIVEAEDVPEASWLALEATVFRGQKAELGDLGDPAARWFRRGSSALSQDAAGQCAGAGDELVGQTCFPAGLETLRKREAGVAGPGDLCPRMGRPPDEQRFAGVGLAKVRGRVPPVRGLGRPYHGLDYGFAKTRRQLASCGCMIRAPLG